jgi:transmembrane sensor
LVEKYKEIFFKYLTDSCNKKELQDFINWVKNPVNENEVKNLIAQDWSEFDFDKYTLGASNKSFENLLQQIGYLNEDQSVINRQILTGPHKPAKIRRTIYRIATSILLPITLGIGSYILVNHIDKSDKLTYNSITAPNGSKTMLKLSDGSVIWLNSGSTLKYPSIFAKDHREVFLSGEGYFEVTKNKSKPFIVKTSDLDIKVLGTKFNLKSYPDEGTIETTLIEGSVSISKANIENDPKNTILLNPNEKATYLKKEGRIIQPGSDKQNQTEQILPDDAPEKEKIILASVSNSEQYSAWKDEKLIFRNENFERICILMERWYNVKINIHSNELKTYHYTGTLENENIIEAIKAFQLTLPFRYEIDHDIIDIWLAQKSNIKKPN